MIAQAPNYFDNGKIELRIDTPDGQLVGSTSVEQGLTNLGGKVVNVPIEYVDGKHDLYIVFVTESEKPVCALILLTFKGAVLQ